MEVGASKEELSAFQAKVTKERKAMEEEFDASSDVIFLTMATAVVPLRIIYAGVSP